MKGVLVSIDINGEMTVTEITDPRLEYLQAGVGGGSIQLVPMFTTFDFRTIRWQCVAFCDEDGKNKGMPFNSVATRHWQQALRNSGHPGLYDVHGELIDYLVGKIAIVWGDDAFMREL